MAPPLRMGHIYEDPQDPTLYPPIVRVQDRYLAVGEVSDVYLCRLVESERLVAVKSMRGISSDPKIRRTFRDQILQLVTQWRTWNHRNVMPCLGLSTQFGPVFGFILPLCKNRSMPRYLQVNPQADRLDLLAQVAAGVGYLHARGFVHADIRGANIMISDEGVPLIMDAGLSLIVSRAEFTVAGIYGPCRWQAPEVLDPSEETVENGDCPYTAKSDIYSLGMTILEVLTGNVPFNHRRYDTVVILDIIRGIRPRRPKDMSDDLWKLLGICWDEKPHKRPTANVVEVWLNTVHHFDECSFE